MKTSEKRGVFFLKIFFHKTECSICWNTHSFLMFWKPLLDGDKVISKGQLRHQGSVFWFRPQLRVLFEYLKTKTLKEKYLLLQGIKSLWITTFREQVLFSWSMAAVCCQWGKPIRNFSVFKIRGYIKEDIYSLSWFFCRTSLELLVSTWAVTFIALDNNNNNKKEIQAVLFQNVMRWRYYSIQDFQSYSI